MKLPKFKPSDRAVDDWCYYMAKAQGIPNVLPFEGDGNAVEPDYWWWLYDTHGIHANCTQPLLAARLLAAKEQANLTVKMWAHDLAEMRILWWWELVEWQVPQWMKTAALRQAGKILRETTGFAPSWCNKIA